MMYIKLYEELDEPIEVGDYIIREEDRFNELKPFFKENYGVVVDIPRSTKKDKKNVLGEVSLIQYIIQYYNVPKELYNFFNRKNGNFYRYCSLDEIIYHSKNKEDVEMKLSTQKYNIG